MNEIDALHEIGVEIIALDATDQTVRIISHWKRFTMKSENIGSAPDGRLFNF